MSKFRTIKTSFNGGEISKQLYGRVDLESFIASNKQMKNVLPTIYGSAMNRGGTVFVNDNIKHFFETLQEVTGVTNINCVSIDIYFNRYVFGCDSGYIARCDFDFTNVVIVQLTYGGNPVGDIMQVAQARWWSDRNSYKISTDSASYQCVPSDAAWSSFSVTQLSGDSDAEILFDLPNNTGKIMSFDGVTLRKLTVQLSGQFAITDSYLVGMDAPTSFDGFRIDDNNIVLVRDFDAYLYRNEDIIPIPLLENNGKVLGARIKDDNLYVYIYGQEGTKYRIRCIIRSLTEQTGKQILIGEYNSDIGLTRAIVVGDKVVCVGTVKSVCIYRNTAFDLDFNGTCLSSAVNSSDNTVLYCSGGNSLHILNSYSYSGVNTKRVLIPFKVNKLINYVVEFGDNIIRFYKNRQLVKDGNGDVYEIGSPYGITDLIDDEGKLKISYVQSVDVLYLCNKDFPIQTLKRYGDANWVIADFSMVGGPFGDVNSDKNKVLVSTGHTGSITIDAENADYNLTLVVTGGTQQNYHNLPKTIWYLNGTAIATVDAFKSIEEAVAILYATADGANFTITVNGNTISVSANSASYSGKTLRLFRRKIGDRLGDTDLYLTTKYDDSATFNSATSLDLFTNNDLGKLIRLNYTDKGTKMWETNKSVNTDDIRKSGNNYYRAVASGTTGQIKPTHTSGSVSDGGVVWEYLHSGYGVGVITEITSASKIQVNVDGYMPDFTDGTYLFEFGIIGGGVYPNCCALYKERFIFSISTSTGTKICASCAGDYNNFSDNSFGDILAENAITVLLQGNQESLVLWMAALNKLYIGTACEEFIFGEQTIAEVLSPTNVMCVKVSSLGSASIMPLHILDELFFVSNNEKQIANFTYIAERDSFRPMNISVMFAHLLHNGVKCWTYTKEPYKTIWFSDKDGNLRSISYDADNKVCAGARHDIGGKVVSLAVIPEPNGNYDELWLVVERVVDNTTCYYTERLSWGLPQEDVSDEYKNKYQIYSDCAKTIIANDMDTSLFGGFYFLEGKQVNVLVDGLPQDKQTVVDGTITVSGRLLPTNNVVVVGLSYDWLIETLFINMGANDGTAQGLPQRVSKIIARFIDTRYFKAKASEGNRYDVICDEDVLTDDDREIHLPSDYSKRMTMFFAGDKPVSCCILMLVGEMKTYQ